MTVKEAQKYLKDQKVPAAKVVLIIEDDEGKMKYSDLIPTGMRNEASGFYITFAVDPRNKDKWA